MIKLLSEIPEVGKVPKHVGDAMFASDGQMGVAFACSLPVSPCVYGGSRVCRRDLRFSALLSCQPVLGSRKSTPLGLFGKSSACGA